MFYRSLTFYGLWGRYLALTSFLILKIADMITSIRETGTNEHARSLDDWLHVSLYLYKVCPSVRLFIRPSVHISIVYTVDVV